MNSMHYVGLDVHKKTISYCVRQADGTIIHEGVMEANRPAVDAWRKQLPDAWTAGMEATMFTGWIYDHLVSNGAAVKVGHAAMLKAIAAGKKKKGTAAWLGLEHPGSRKTFPGEALGDGKTGWTAGFSGSSAKAIAVSSSIAEAA